MTTDTQGFLPRWCWWALIALASLHLLLNAIVVINNVSHEAITSSTESLRALCAYQYSIGEDSYELNDPLRIGDGYMPFLFQTFGLVFMVFGMDIRYLRATVALFGVGILVMTGLLVTRMTGSRKIGFLGAALASAISRPGWFALLNNDMPHVFFALVTLYLLIRKPRVSWLGMLGVVAASFGCYWSKQTGLAYIAASVLCLFLDDRRKGFAALGLQSLLIGSTTAWFASRPGSDFLYCVFGWYANEPKIWSRVWTDILFPEMLGRFGVLWAMVVAGFVAVKWTPRNILRPEYVFLGTSAIVSLSRIKYGSGPSHQFILDILLIAIGLAFALDFFRRGQLAPAAVAGLLFVQCGALFRPFPDAMIDWEDGQRYQTMLNMVGTPGRNVLYINQGYLNLLAGKGRYGMGGVALDRMIREAPFDMVIVDLPLWDGLANNLAAFESRYQAVQKIPAKEGATLTSGEFRFEKLVYMRKDLLSSSQGDPLQRLMQNAPPAVTPVP